MTKSKTSPGNYFEDFRVGQVLRHATPRTVTRGDIALYNALYGSRFAVQSSDDFAQRIRYPEAPVDDLLVFHIVFGKTVPDISLNAVANLGYAGGRFLALGCEPSAELHRAASQPWEVVPVAGDEHRARNHDLDDDDNMSSSSSDERGGGGRN